MASATAQPASAQRDPDTRAAVAEPSYERPELSPLWSLVVVLGEIAQRVERGQTEEHEDDE